MVKLSALQALPLALLLLLACAPSQTAPAQPGSPLTPTEAGLKPGQRAPDFQLTTLEGQPLASAQLSGKPLVLYFFATW